MARGPPEAHYFTLLYFTLHFPLTAPDPAVWIAGFRILIHVWNDNGDQQG